ncbi:MAG: hypothetical protein B6244_07515 [Candidatus Cloacimonetes bacterium 4572_55]|nr:MAG: hypothetical protein B6244_07515 [Candidatus Cloacimonetes bacterium 4572_55]
MILYSLSEAFQRFRRSPGMVILSAFVIAILVYVFGLFLLLTANLNQIVHDVRDRIEMIGYFQESLTQTRIDSALAEIRGHEMVLNVVFQSKEKNLALFKEEFGQQTAFLDAIETNPLPASVRIQIQTGHKTSEKLARLASDIRGIDGIESVQFGGKWVRRLDRIVDTAMIIDVCIGIMIALGGIFIISNTIKLTIFARKDAIDIMKLVGATHTFIRMPIIFEGLIEGIIGGLIAVGLIFGSYYVAGQYISPLVPLNILTLTALALLAALLGGTGSYVSIRKFLQ